MDNDTADIQSEVAARAERAVQHSRNVFRITLDYSPESLQQVEEILDQLYSLFAKPAFQRSLNGKVTPEQIINEVVTFYGSYVGEVIRLRWGGEWSTKSTAFTEPTMTLHLHGKEIEEIFPLNKVYKRLTNGPEDGIWFYYFVIARDFEEDVSL